MAEEVKQPGFPDMTNGIDYSKYTVEDPESTRGGEISGEPYVQPSLFMHILKSLKPGQDLTRVLIPVFFLSPRSLLEHLGDMLMHIDLLDSPDLQCDDAYKRFMILIKWYLSSWHYKSYGCKKPYNPIIGETFSCIVDTAESRVSYVAEQCSHHPPVSAFYLENQKKGYCANGYIWTKSHFTGNSAASEMVGNIEFYLPKFDEVYTTIIPSFAGTGLFIGTLRMQLIDKLVFECKKTGYRAEIEFHGKPMIGGDYNRVTAVIKHDGKVIHHLHGKWDECLYLTDAKKQNEEVFLDVRTMPVLPKKVLDVPYQGPYESRRLWNNVTQAIRKSEGPDWKTVEENKTKLENDQRALPCQQKHDSPNYRPWTQKLFMKVLHTGSGKMENGYRFKYFDLNMVKPDAPYRDFLALSRNVHDERAAPEKMEDLTK